MEELTWKLSVPKICHFYWGGGKLIYMRYLSVKSFMKYNPDWQIYFWYPMKSFAGRSWGTEFDPNSIKDELCKDYLSELLELPINKMPIDFINLGFKDDAPEVHKNDYMRIFTLYCYGGVWSDTDIIYFKSLNELKVNKEENRNKQVYVCISPDYGHSTGFNMAIKDNEFFKKLIDKYSDDYKRYEYQCWGPDLFNKYFETIESVHGGVNLDMDVVYAHNCYYLHELRDGSAPKFTDGSIGCHWYGGSVTWAKFLNETGGGERNLPNNIIGNLIKNV